MRWNRPRAAERYGLARDKIILSAKVSGVQDLIAVYRDLAAQCDYALHLGLTEAGLGSKGIVAHHGSAVRPAAGGHRRHHSRVPDARCRMATVPKKSSSRSRFCSRSNCAVFTPQVAACPGCGRTTSTFFQDMADQIQTYLREQMPVWREQHPGVEEMKVAVMGCVVNGPGESKHANIGISLPGRLKSRSRPCTWTANW